MNSHHFKPRRERYRDLIPKHIWPILYGKRAL